MFNIQHQIDRLQPFVSSHKQELISTVLENRTRNITVVLEDIYHPQNASAVIRTCECFGLQDLYVVSDKHDFRTSPRVVHGSNKWVSLLTFDSGSNKRPIHSCFHALRSSGYQIVATSPAPEALPVSELKPAPKMAFVFGDEISGVSDYTVREADSIISIPMYGFTDSFNLSVSVGLVIQQILDQHKEMYPNWHLSEGEKNILKLEWYKKIVRRSDLILGRP